MIENLKGKALRIPHREPKSTPAVIVIIAHSKSFFGKKREGQDRKEENTTPLFSSEKETSFAFGVLYRFDTTRPKSASHSSVFGF